VRREIKSFSKPYNECVNGIAIGNGCDAAAAWGADEARKARGASDKVAAQYATEIFEQVANTATTLESTELQAEARDNLLVATVMAFTSDVAKVQNLLMQAKMRGTLPRTISAIIASMLVSALVDYLFSLLTEKEPEDRQAIVVRRLASEAIGLLPGGVTVGAPLVDWMTQTTEYRPQILQTSLLDTMNKAYKAGTELIDAAEAYFVDEDAETGYDKLMAGLGDAADTAGSLAGLPVGIYRNLVQKSIERFD